MTAILAAGLIVGACAGTAVTTSPSASPTSETPEPSPIATPWASSAPVGFPVVRGTAPLAAPADDSGVAAATRINDFGFDLLRHLASKGNLCASPTSIALALAMVRPGARGATATEMDRVLRSLGASGQDAQIVALLGLLNSLTRYGDAEGFSLEPGATPDPAYPDPVVELRVANQVFSQPGMTLEQAYLNSLSSSFGAGVGQLDFKKDPEAARLIINKWVGDNTRGLIPQILQSGDLDTLTRIVLANAVYLNAAWADPFDPANTKPRIFTTASGAAVNVPTMATREMLQYGKGTGYRVVVLPLREWSMSMTIVVPENMGSFTAGLTAAKLVALTPKTADYDVDLTMPRFSIDSRFELAQALESMGMNTLFDPSKADLSGITKAEILYVQHVIHQANIKVVEEGVTASAATAVVGGKGSAGIPPPHVQFDVNKPFLYFIRESASGAVLFMGRVDDPSIAG